MNKQPQQNLTEKEQIKKIAGGVFTAATNSFAMPIAAFLLTIIIWGGSHLGDELIKKLQVFEETQITMMRLDTTLKNVESRLIRIENALDKRRN